MSEVGIGSGGNTGNGIRRVGLRAEIDTSPPFKSVKEAVTRFGGSGPWIPLYKLGEAYNNIEDFDIKKVEEQAAQLEKDLIVKELETLDVLEELGATKRIVEELKQQLHTEALKCFATQDVNSDEQVEAPVIKEMNQENRGNVFNNQQQILRNPCPMSTPDPFLVDLKQAKMTLGKTINELGAIQSSVESLNKKMKKERLFLERTREMLASKFAAISAQERTQEEARSNPLPHPAERSCTFDYPPIIVENLNPNARQNDRMIETRCSEVSKLIPEPEFEENGLNIKSAEMKLFAAKKMEEAARTAEVVALAEIKALSSAEISFKFAQPEPKKVTFALGEYSPLNPKTQIPEESTLKKVTDSKIDLKFQIDEINTSKLSILKKLEEAAEEVVRSKQLLTQALNSVETANRKQHAAKEALRRWIPEDDPNGQAVFNSIKRNKFEQGGHCQEYPLPNVTRSVNNDRKKPFLRSTVSMRDVLSRKQVPEEYTTTKEMEEHKVALSQMLRALKEDLTLPTIPEKDGSDNKQFTAQRKKFGFIQISLPLGKLSKKRA
ncbi:hypothetical protein RIF29_17598 [Crotalaria pallida]|uniref:Uncharacterized protein n=1 Tax=Crotalaria pallida TaxID=3830 RepID=A0AAN9IFG4_CROPI